MATQPQSKTSPVFELANLLRQAHLSSGVIRFTDPLVEAFKALAAAKGVFPSGAIEILVEALDATAESNLCKRLHPESLSLLTAVFRLSTPCQAQERGFYLIVDCLHHGFEPASAVDPVSKNKKTMLMRHLDWLIARFLESARPNQQRRAMGAFALELLIGSEDNVARMGEPDQERRLLALGRMIHAEESEILKLIAGSIIREMLSHGLMPHQFWSSQESSQQPRAFPICSSHTSQWIYEFECFAEDQRRSSSEKELVVFAAAAIVGETIYTIEGVSAILVAVGTGLSFAMLPATADPSLFFDINVHDIQSIEHSDSQSQPVSQATMSQRPRQFCLIVRLAQSEVNYYLNAKAGHVDSIMLVYDHPKDAELVADALSNLWFKIHDKTLEVEASGQLLSVQNEPELSNLSKGAEQRPDIGTDGDRDGMMASDTVFVGRSPPDDVLVASEIRYAAQGNEVLQNLRLVEEETSETDLEKPVGSQDNDSVFDVDGQKGRAVRERAYDKSAFFRSIDNPGTAISIQQGKASSATAGVLDPGVQINMQTDQRSSQRIPASNLYDATPSPQSHSPGLREESDTLANKPAVMGTVRPGDKIVKRMKMSHQMRDHRGYTVSQLEDLEGNTIIAKPHKDSDLTPPSIHEGRSSALNKSSSRGIEQTLGATNRIPKSIKSSLQHPKRDTKAANARGSQNAKSHQLLHQSFETSKSERSTALERKAVPSKSFSAATQVSSSRKPNGRVSALHTGFDTSLINVPDTSVNWDEAYEAQNDKESPAKGKATKPIKRRKPAANQKKSRVHPSTPRSSRAKESVFPLGNQRARRTAAVKANKAIQGIAEDESSETTEHSSDDSPVVRPLMKASAIGSENRNLPIPTAPMAPVRKAPPKAKVSPTGKSKVLSQANTTPHSESLTNGKPTQPSRALVATEFPAPATPRVYTPLTVFKSPIPERSMISTAAESRPIQTPSAAENLGLGHEKGFSENIHAGIPAPGDSSNPAAATEAEQLANEEINEQIDASVANEDATSNVPAATNSHAAPSNRGDHVPGPLSLTKEGTKPLETITSKELNCHPPNIVQEGPNGKISTSKNGSKIVESMAEAATAQFFPETHTRAESHDNHTEAEIEQPFFTDAMEFADEPDTAVWSDPPQVPVQTGDVQWHLQDDDHPLAVVQSNHSKATKKTIGKPVSQAKPLTAAKLQSALSRVPQLHPVQSAETINSAIKSRPSQGELKRYGEKQQNEVEEPSDFHRAQPDSRISQKRRLDPADEGRGKKRRVMEGKQTESAHDGQLDGQQSTSRAPNVYRKPNIVHFESAGPANQGPSAGKKRKTSPVQNHEDTNDLQLIVNEGIEGGRDQARSAPIQKVLTPPKKRPKVEVVKTSGLTTTRLFPQPTKSPIFKSTEPFRLASSQSSRVDEFGSPRLLHADSNAAISLPKALLQPTNRLPDLEEILEPDNEFSFQGGDLKPVKAGLITQTQRKFSPKLGSSTAVSVNSKHRPSSPLAPSSIVTDLAAHEEQPSGRLIDIYTARVIEPRKPQNPFLEAARERPNAFLEKLKKASEIRTGKGQTHGKESDIPAQNILQNDDPEKTLIGEITSGDECVSNTPSAPSSSSESSSSADSKSVNDGDDKGVLAWRQAIDPHEQDIAKALDRILARIISGFGDRRTRLQGLIEGYRQEGEMIVDKFTESRTSDYAGCKAKGKSAKEELAKFLQHADKDLGSKVVQFKKEMEGLRTDWEVSQKKTNSGVERLLALCMEED